MVYSLGETDHLNIVLVLIAFARLKVFRLKLTAPKLKIRELGKENCRFPEKAALK